MYGLQFITIIRGPCTRASTCGVTKVSETNNESVLIFVFIKLPVDKVLYQFHVLCIDLTFDSKIATLKTYPKVLSN